MRILVISDIHANYTALEAVLNEATAIDEVWCLGDLVGYGPDPNECINRLKNLPKLSCVVGNHDAALLGQIDVNTFNRDARLPMNGQSPPSLPKTCNSCIHCQKRSSRVLLPWCMAVRATPPGNI